MSTEFHPVGDTSELGFVRYGRSRGMCYEFGTVSNMYRVRDQMQAGISFVPIDGDTRPSDPLTVEDLDQLIIDGFATFGEFPVTVNVFSDEYLRFTVEL